MIVHALNLKSDNERSIHIAYSHGEKDKDIAGRISKQLADLKYDNVRGISIEDQFDNLINEFEAYCLRIRIRIIHPMSTRLRNAIGANFNSMSYCKGCQFNQHGDEKFKIIMHSTKIWDRQYTMDGLNLDQLSGVNAELYYGSLTCRMTITFNSLNDHKKMKLIGTIDFIRDHYDYHTIQLPASYIEYLEYVDNVECIPNLR